MVVALNKVDLVPPARIAARLAEVGELVEFHAVHPVSARTGDGVAALRDELVTLAPEGPPLYPPGTRSGDPLRLRIAELVREQALRLTRQEVPHAVAVVVDELEPGTRRRAARVEATVVCETASQRGILVGKGGSMIRDIGTAARPEIERVLGGQVMLDLRVRVERHWRDDPRLLDRLGPADGAAPIGSDTLPAGLRRRPGVEHLGALALQVDDDVGQRQAEALPRTAGHVAGEPARAAGRVCRHHERVGREPAQRVLDGHDRVRVADGGLGVDARPAQGGDGDPQALLGAGLRRRDVAGPRRQPAVERGGDHQHLRRVAALRGAARPRAARWRGRSRSR